MPLSKVSEYELRLVLSSCVALFFAARSPTRLLTLNRLLIDDNLLKEPVALVNTVFTSFGSVWDPPLPRKFYLVSLDESDSEEEEEVTDDSHEGSDGQIVQFQRAKRSRKWWIKATASVAAATLIGIFDVHQPQPLNFATWNFNTFFSQAVLYLVVLRSWALGLSTKRKTN